MKKPTLTQMYEFCKAHYYSGEENLWEPFEYYEKAQIAEFVSGVVIALSEFLELNLSTRII